jgi:aminoglycoside phosphotransferase (APT) family kinase protein
MHETAPARPGEQLDLLSLAMFLEGKLEGGTSGFAVEQFTGGHSNLTYALHAGGHDYVLRRGPMGPVPPKAHDMAREFRILKAVHPHFEPAPKAVLFCEDLSVLGCVFYLMERRRGIIIREEIQEELAGKQGEVSEAFIDCLAQLHSVSITEPEIAGLGKPDGFLKRQVSGWSERWVKAQTSSLPAMDSIMKWLAASTPMPLSPTIVHNDFKLDNVMFEVGESLRVNAVLDWEMTTIGDPLVDVGLTLCYWRLGSVSSATKSGGLYTREQFLDRYYEKTGRNLAFVHWYEILGVFKLAVILQQIYFRYHHGHTKDERFSRFDKRVSDLVNDALEMLERNR